MRDEQADLAKGDRAYKRSTIVGGFKEAALFITAGATFTALGFAVAGLAVATPLWIAAGAAVATALLFNYELNVKRYAQAMITGKKYKWRLLPSAENWEDWGVGDLPILIDRFVTRPWQKSSFQKDMEDLDKR